MQPFWQHFFYQKARNTPSKPLHWVEMKCAAPAKVPGWHGGLKTYKNLTTL